MSQLLAGHKPPAKTVSQVEIPPASNSPSRSASSCIAAWQPAWPVSAARSPAPTQSTPARPPTTSGLCAVGLLKAKLGASRVGATTRGADEVFVDGGAVAGQVAASAGGKSDKVLELVGTRTVLDSARCLKPAGTVCITGIQGGEWVLNSFNPMDLPDRVRLCGYGGGPEDFWAVPWEELVKDVDEGRINVPYREFKMEDIQKIHEVMESGGGGAKMVVVVSEE